MKDKRTVARIKIPAEYYEEKLGKKINLVEFYGEWYKFDNKELDVFLVSESWMDKAKTIKNVTYGYEDPEGKVRFIPEKHCEMVYKFL